MRSAPWVALAVVGVILGATEATSADGSIFAPDVEATMSREVALHGEIFDRWRQCPADIHAKSRTFWSGIIANSEYDIEDCAKDPAHCLAACFEALNGDACFTIGYGMQDDAQPALARRWEAMYAYACALGHPGGCTNRAAGILQGNFPNDPFGSDQNAAKACSFRSFEQSCALEDPWGCTMLGQAYEDGEGVAIDKRRARTAYRRACDLSPDFSACFQAKDRITVLDAQR